MLACVLNHLDQILHLFALLFQIVATTNVQQDYILQFQPDPNSKPTTSSHGEMLATSLGSRPKLGHCSKLHVHSPSRQS
jgi:hypothetical protein